MVASTASNLGASPVTSTLVVRIDRTSGLTEPTEEDAEVKRAMIQVAQEVIALADHSKFGRVAFAHVAPASAVDVLITDELADCAPFEDLNWEVQRVFTGSEARRLEGD
jgi:DeoR/GlpR family transcriptional regulator of sugar metabolism